MRTRMKKIFVALLIMAMAVTGMNGTGDKVQAATGSYVKLDDTTKDFEVKPGETNTVQMKVITSEQPIYSPVMTVSAGTDAPFSFNTPVIKYNDAKVDTIYQFNYSDLLLDVKVNEDAKIGSYPVTITFAYTDYATFTDTTSKITINLIVKEEKDPAQLTVGGVKLTSTNIGSKTDISFTVKNEGTLTARNAYLTMDFGDSIEGRYTAKSIKLDDMDSGETKNITLPVTILTTATTGRKTITAKFTYKTSDGVSKTSDYAIYVNLTSADNASQLPKINIEKMDYTKGLKPNDNFDLKVNLENIGGSAAKDVNVTVDSASVDSSGILKNYFTDGINVDSIASDSKETVSIPLTVSKYATSGLKAVKVVIKYTDASGNSYTVNDTAYIDIATAAATPTPIVEAPNIIIKNVSQSPELPQAGGKVEMSFDVENKGTVDAKELKILTDGLTTATFIPINAEPYQYFETLKAGDTIRVTIPLTVSETIVEGLNSITVKYSYTGGDGSVSIPVRNVENNIVNISKPKIIVSNYVTDVAELRAGGTFNFTLDLYNTNASIAAKNITVTISQADNIYSVTQGSNSFFIEKMGPGETITKTLEMRVKNDASTKTYPLVITIEYEYDGIEANPTTGEIGEKRTETLNLQATENSRPVVNNINVYSWDGNVMAGSTATLAFEFYNMGKSQLDNVIAYVEGDFTKADGNMYFIGNVAAGSSSYVEFDVTPNIAGTANGKLRVTFENSNGDTIENTYDFTAEVMDAGMIDNGGGVIGGDGSGEVFNPEVPLTKQPILPIWAFVLVEIVIFALFVPITRKIVISAYKAKLRKKEFDQY